MVGFVPKEAMPVHVTTGAGPLVVNIPVVPAGAVVGRVLNAEGRPVVGSSVTLLPTEKSWQASVAMPTRYESTDARGRFALPDVPLDAEFRLLASQDSSFVSKGPLVLDAAHPVAKVDIRLPAGVDLRGRLVGPEDQPVGDAEVTLSYDSGVGSSWGALAVTSSPDGWFSIKGFNPDVPGRYGLSIRPHRGYQPTDIDPLRWQGKPLQLRLEPGLSAEGVVLQEGTDYPIPGATVMAEPLGASLGGFQRVPSEGPTDERGRFRFSNLAPGVYKLRFFDGTLEALNFAAGQKEPVVAHVKQAPWSRLEPHKPEQAQ